MHKLHKTIQTEELDPIDGTIKGKIPSWIEGSLYRNGPGMFEIGEHHFNHFFDGMAMIQRFHISGGKVTYQRRYQHTDAYTGNMAAKANIYSEFGTRAVPDPCKNIFRRFLTYFKTGELTDNTVVSLFLKDGDLYATTETCFVNKIDPETLEKLEKVDIMKSGGLFLSVSHPHWEADGTVHYVGHNFTGGMKTKIVTFPPKPEKDAPFPTANPVCTIPSPWKVHINYYHSFGITENYYVLLQQPFMFNVVKMALPPMATPDEALQWYPDTPVRFRIIDRKTGKDVNGHVTYQTDAFVFFHHINAYEEDGHVVVDVVCHKDKEVLDYFYMKNLTSVQWQEALRKVQRPEARRYVLPLEVDREAEEDANFVTLKDSEAKCLKRGNNVFHCQCELLADIGVEFPTISYDRYNGVKYRYIYAMKFETTAKHQFSVLKIDTFTKTYKEWIKANCYPSEPIFIPRPGGTEEDDGVVVTAVNRSDYEEGHDPFFLVLDAKTLEEVGRAEINGIERFPRDLHGIFFPK